MAEEIKNQTSTLPPSGSDNPSYSAQPDPKQLLPSSRRTTPDGELPMLPIMYPTHVPAIFPPEQGQEETDHGSGIYAIPPFPECYGTRGGEQGQAGQLLQQQPQAGQQSEIVVWQFQCSIDLMLILKLGAVIYYLNHDGSRKRLVLLIFLASLIYLYQTGALAPFIRWLTQGMQRAAVPPQPPRLPAAAWQENILAAARQENENAPLLDGKLRTKQWGAANEGGNKNNNRLWEIVKDIQLIVFGFITSLLPAFHNID